MSTIISNLYDIRVKQNDTIITYALITLVQQ